MTICLMRKAVRPTAAALAVMGVLLAGCSGGEDSKPSAPGSIPTRTTTDVDAVALGKALDKLVFQGGQQKSADGGACLYAAVKNAGLSEEGQAYIVKTSGDDEGAVVEGLRTIDVGDAELLLSPQLREEFDACADGQLREQKGSGERGYEPPTPAGTSAGQKANLRPTYEIMPDARITSATQLTDGLVSMFSSYAEDEKQKQTYRAAGQCLAGVAFAAGFSQETLRFLAGGAPIGAGSVADYLPKDEDKKIWESKDFTTALADCTATATPVDSGGQAT